MEWFTVTPLFVNSGLIIFIKCGAPKEYYLLEKSLDSQGRYARVIFPFKYQCIEYLLGRELYFSTVHT